MEESEKEKWEMEGMGLWLYISRAKTGKIAGYRQASIGAQDLRAVGNSLDK